MIYNLRSRALAVLLLLVLAIGLIPTVAMAANTATVQINGQTLLDGVPVQCGEGTAVLDEESGTLTLNNATISQETTDNYTIRVSNGELKVILIGENTITSTNKKAFYCGTVDLAIQGTERDSLIIETDSDGLQVDNGNLTIDGCNVDITSTSFGGMMCFGGILTIQNSANVTIDSYENSLIGNDGLFIKNSTVNAIVHAVDYKTCAVFSNGNLNIENSMLDASSKSDCAFYSLGVMSITDSVVKAQSPGSGYTIYGAGGLSLTGTWLDNVDNEAYLSNADTVENCVIIDYEDGIVVGNPVIKRDVELCNGATLTIPKQASLTLAEGMTFTNNGTIILNGDFINSNAFVICADGSHVGGTATCTSKAVCALCGNEYGDLVSHNLTKTEAQAATCTEEGNTEYWYCETCKKYFSDSEGKNEIAPESTVIPATSHSYENGKCTVCGAIDPNFTPEIIAGANGAWRKGTQDGLSFTSNAAFDDFIKVQVDGKDLDASNYTTKEGSTIVTLKASYLETLSVGKHTLAIVSDTGIAETEFTILAASNSDESLVQTGDNNMSLVALLSIIGAMSAVIGVVALRKSRL